MTRIRNGMCGVISVVLDWTMVAAVSLRGFLYHA